MSENVMDSRDLQEELESIKNIKEELSTGNKEKKEAILELKKETEYSGWEHGITFISEYYWKDYCQEFAEEVGYVSADNNPLMYCINWQEWADLMQQDYSEVEFEGRIYYYREA
jgi:hypothetical protein